MPGSDGPPQAATSLESTTKLDGVRASGWLLALYGDAAEASGSFRSLASPAPRGGGAPASDETRSEEEAARRARGKVRRYCAANRLNRLGTLTYRGSGCDDPAQLRADVATFFRSLRAQVGKPIPYLWVPEWHPGGHGLHVQFGLGRYIHYTAIRRAWGQGFIHITELNDLPAGSTVLDEARVAARYLAKYVAKTYAAGGEGSPGAQRRRVPGLHRYEVAQGFQPRATLIRGHSAGDVLRLASARMGGRPTYVWESWNEPRWFGPSAIWASWTG